MRVISASPALAALVLVTLSSAVLGAGCGGDGPSDELLSRARSMRSELDRLREAFPDPATLEPSECPPGLRARRLDWTYLCNGACAREGWINQLGTEGYLDRPVVYSLAPYTNDPSPGLTRELQEAVDAYEAADHLRVARVTELVHGRRTGEDTFVPGHAVVWVVTFDRRTHAVVCAETFRVDNLDSVFADEIARQVEDRVRARLRQM